MLSSDMKHRQGSAIFFGALGACFGGSIAGPIGFIIGMTIGIFIGIERQK